MLLIIQCKNASAQLQDWPAFADHKLVSTDFATNAEDQKTADMTAEQFQSIVTSQVIPVVFDHMVL